MGLLCFNRFLLQRADHHGWRGEHSACAHRGDIDHTLTTDNRHHPVDKDNRAIVGTIDNLLSIDMILLQRARIITAGGESIPPAPIEAMPRVGNRQYQSDPNYIRDN